MDVGFKQLEHLLGEYAERLCFSSHTFGKIDLSPFCILFEGLVTTCDLMLFLFSVRYS